MLTPEQLQQFAQDGFLICPGLADAQTLAQVRARAHSELAAAREPLEREHEVHYPGSPPDVTAPGGQTVRRLLQAYDRAPEFAHWGRYPAVVDALRQLLGEHLLLVRAHHNCLMTKQPRYSSDTGWHRDIRYWRFARAELISVWLALDSERPNNGGLWVVPGSHLLSFPEHCYDERLFLRPDQPETKAWLERSVPVELQGGDVLFFHSRVLHAASRNYTQQAKLSLVFTYRAAENLPLANTRSAQSQDVPL